MSCPSCLDAERDVLSHSFNQTCLECASRALAHGQAFFYANKVGDFTSEYLNALKSFSPADPKGFHKKVKAWADRMNAAKGLSHG